MSWIKVEVPDGAPCEGCPIEKMWNPILNVLECDYYKQKIAKSLGDSYTKCPACKKAIKETK